MSARSAPLRFLMLLMICWGLTRGVVHWLRESAPTSVPAPIVTIDAAQRTPRDLSPPIVFQEPISPKRATMSFVSRAVGPWSLASDYRAPPDALASTLDVHAFERWPGVTGGEASNLAPSPALQPDIVRVRKPLDGGWSASGWFVLRDGGSGGLAPGAGQLGASQMGARVVYQIDRIPNLAAFARVTAPLRGRGREITFGAEWKLADLPLYATVERRFGIDGTKAGPGIGLVAGVDREVGVLRVEGYGQAGVIWRTKHEPYIDGAVRLMRPISSSDRRVLRAGAGIWGGAQREVARLDVGPSISVAQGGLQFRVDWRQRIAGNAHPGSGVTFTVGGDF